MSRRVPVEIIGPSSRHAGYRERSRSAAVEWFGADGGAQAAPVRASTRGVQAQGASGGRGRDGFVASLVKGAANVAASATGSFIREIKGAVEAPSPEQRAEWDRRRYERQLDKDRRAMNALASRLRRAEIERAEAQAVLNAQVVMDAAPDAEPEDVAEAALSAIGHGTVEVDRGTFGGRGGEGRAVGLLRRLRARGAFGEVGKWGRSRVVFPDLAPGSAFGAAFRGVRRTIQVGRGEFVVGSRSVTAQPITVDLGNGLHVLASVDRTMAGFGDADVIEAIERAAVDSIKAAAVPGAVPRHWTAFLPWDLDATTDEAAE